jgi:hypothetical protein
LGLYNCLDGAYGHFEFGGGALDVDGNPLEIETAAQPPDRSSDAADAHIASQDARCQPQDTVPFSNRCHTNAAMGSAGFGGRSSDDSSSKLSSGRKSAWHSVTEISRLQIRLW